MTVAVLCITGCTFLTYTLAAATQLTVSSATPSEALCLNHVAVVATAELLQIINSSVNVFVYYGFSSR